MTIRDIISNVFKKEEKHAVRALPEHRYSKKVRIWTIVGTSAMALIGVLCITVSAVGMHWLSRINFETPDEDYDPNAAVTPNDDSGLNYTDPFDEDLHVPDALADIALRGNQDGVRNIMLLGIDSNNFSGRSDTMMILSINDNDKTIKLVSLQRDTWVSIPGRDRNGDGADDIEKLTHAYAYGKFSLLRKTVAQNFRIDIDDYLGVNFKVLPVVIDVLGGIDMKLTAKEMALIPAPGCTVSYYDHDPSFVPLTGEPGTYHLSGFQALEYARIRKIDSDFQRAERQRKVINQLIKKAGTMSYTQLINAVYSALPYLDTNMSSDEFLGFAANAVKYTSYTIDMNYSIPSSGTYKGTYINGGSGLQLLDPRQTVTDLHKHLYGY